MSQEPPASRKILRFRRSERLLHWSIALPFLVCFGTALILVLLRGGDPYGAPHRIVSRIHRLSGLCMIVLPILALLGGWRDLRVHLRNIREGWLWSTDDIKWLALMPLSLLSRKVSLPSEGKFNAGEKLNFMMTMLAYPVLGVTGVLIWRREDFFLPWIIHILFALAIAPLIGGHIFMAVINPATRKGLGGMISGFVDREWAKHHYRRWYREKFGGEDAASNPVPAARRWAWFRTFLGAAPALVFLFGLSVSVLGYVETLTPLGGDPAHRADAPSRVRSFEQTIPLDPEHLAEGAGRVADTILPPLRSLQGASVEITLQLRVTSDDGLDPETLAVLRRETQALRVSIGELPPD
ncbi:MAG: formate dehydrogenase subunit gamma [Myxococcota bacterium]